MDTAATQVTRIDTADGSWAEYRRDTKGMPGHTHVSTRWGANRAAAWATVRSFVDAHGGRA